MFSAPPRVFAPPLLLRIAPRATFASHLLPSLPSIRPKRAILNIVPVYTNTDAENPGMQIILDGGSVFD